MATRNNKTLQQVAELAGVSASTVSRVINSVPGIAPETAENVRRVIASMHYSPTLRRRDNSTLNSGLLKGTQIAFAVLSNNNASVYVPFYDQLLRGVSSACNEQQLDLKTFFFTDVNDAISKLPMGRIGGLLLLGQCPPVSQAGMLKSVPVVWLMGNRRRPTWGDQVMPDNVAIGQIAGQYLLQQGHREVVYFGLRTGWSLTIRSLAFQQTIEDAGAAVKTVLSPVINNSEIQSDEVNETFNRLIQEIASSKKRPTGIFVGEDMLVPRLVSLLERQGLHVGRGKDIEIITCNNDRARLLGLDSQPVNIDLRTEEIGRRGVDHLAWRILRRDNIDRLRLMVEPQLIIPRT